MLFSLVQLFLIMLLNHFMKRYSYICQPPFQYTTQLLLLTIKWLICCLYDQFCPSFIPILNSRILQITVWSTQRQAGKMTIRYFGSCVRCYIRGRVLWFVVCKCHSLLLSFYDEAPQILISNLHNNPIRAGSLLYHFIIIAKSEDRAWLSLSIVNI